MSDEIFTAIHEGDLITIARLVERDRSVARARNQNGVSAIMQAVYENRPEVVDALRCSAGELDLYEAAALGDVDRLQKLLGADASQVNSKSNDGFTPLHLACFFRHPEAAQVLLAAGADPKAVSAHSIAVIHSAAASNDATVVRLVLAAGADPNVLQNGGYTALQAAAMNNNPEMARILLAAGADRSMKNDQGHSAYDVAKTAGANEVVELVRP